MSDERIKLEEILDRVGEDARDATVYVVRQPGGGGWRDGGPVALGKLDNFHIRTISGGRQEPHLFPRVYAYGSCLDLPVGHTGSHGGSCPHRILACVESADRDDVWEALCEATGYEPPSETDRARKRMQVKREILERMDATEGGPLTADPSPPGPKPQPPFESHEFTQMDHESWLYALARGTEPFPQDRTIYFDRETHCLVCVEEGADMDGREHPHEEGRYEEIQPLKVEELRLLTRSDLEEIAAAFWRARRVDPD